MWLSGPRDVTAAAVLSTGLFRVATGQGHSDSGVGEVLA